MNLFDRIARQFGYMKTQRVNEPAAWLRAEGAAAQWGMPDGAMWEHQSSLYQRLSWVQTAVSMVAQVAATTAFEVKRADGGKMSDIPNHPFEMLLRKPNPMESRFELLFSTFAFEALTGNAYWWLNRRDEFAEPSEIWALEPHKVTPVPDGQQYLRGYVYRPSTGADIALEPWEVVHFRRFHPLDRYVGLSPIEALATVAEGDLGMQRWNTGYFAKDYAKPAGALAYADPIEKTEWDRMKSETRREFGGTKRNLLMLQNVGKGGVDWIPMNISHRDMEFIQGRTFTREEIFGIYAPGLASMLAVNATEANSKAGKATFLEFAVWPQLSKVAEKITNDLLPVWGENIVGKFEDVRITDRAMQLQEQSAFAQVHTVDEIRQKYYGSKPIGDERGSLLPTEVAKGGAGAAPVPVDSQNSPAGQNSASDNAIGFDATNQNVDSMKIAEEKALKAWLKKRKNPDLSKFKAVHLSLAEMRAIAGVKEAATEQDFFTWTGKAIRRSAFDDGADKERAAMEREHAAAIDTAFSRLLKKVLPPGTTTENITPDLAVERYKANENILRDAIIEMLTDAALFGAEFGMHWLDRATGARKAVTVGGANWDLINQDVLHWVLGTGNGTFGQGYGDSVLLGQLFQTSEQSIRSAIGEWIQNGLPLRQLVQTLERTIFSSQRAEMIAVTEVTRAFAEGNRAAWRQSGVITRMRWETAEDERVCPTCAPLQNQLADLTGVFDGGFFPPAHPRCRCWITPVIVGVNDGN